MSPNLSNLVADWKKEVAKWDNDELVWSVSLGGIGLGPSYEQAIQILLWEIMSRWGDQLLSAITQQDGHPIEYTHHANKVADELCLGLSGAQFYAAKNTAFQFMKYSYKTMMDRLPKERRIQVSRNFPSWKH